MTIRIHDQKGHGGPIDQKVLSDIEYGSMDTNYNVNLETVSDFE